MMPATPGHTNSKTIIDYFLHPTFSTDRDLLHRARVLVSVLCAFTLITGFAIPTAFFVPMQSSLQPIVAICCAMVAVAFIYLLYMLKLHGRYSLCASVAVSIPIISIAVATHFTGGVSVSPVVQLVVLQPLFAYFVTGIRGGLVTTISIAVLILFLFFLKQAEIEPSSWVPVEKIGILSLGILSIGFLMIAAMALIYEFSSSALRRERDDEHEKVVHLANTDSLTGLTNRRAFDNALNDRINAFQSEEDSQQFSLCYLDLDGFKPINDQHGHDVGDQVLRTVSIRLRSVLRGNDVIGRQGGDEFMLLLEGLVDGTTIELMAQRFISLVNQPIETSAGLISVGASLGFAVYPQHAISADTLKKAADEAMYAAKRNRVGWLLYTSHMPWNQSGRRPQI